MSFNVHGCWTCVQEEPLFLLGFRLKICFQYNLSYSTSTYWFRSIWFGASTLIFFWPIYEGKYLLGNKLHFMGGICREEYWWYIFIKLPFRWLDKLSMSTYWWMIDQSSYCVVIVTYDEINSKTAAVEWIFYHIQMCSRFHTFRSPLKFIWALVFFWPPFPLINSITLFAGIWIEEHNDNKLGDSSNDEGMPSRGVIYTTIWYLLSHYIICNGKFHLVFIYLLAW